jgi:hypothetical protein
MLVFAATVKRYAISYARVHNLNYTTRHLLSIVLTFEEHRSECTGNLHVTILVGCLHLTGDARLAIDLGLFGDGACAGNHVIKMSHPFETHIKFAECVRANIVTEQLSYKPHDEHAM